MTMTAEIGARAGKPAPTVVDVEQRVLRACKTLRAIPDPDKRFRVMHSPWPEIVTSAEEAYGYTEVRMPRFKPTPADVDDMLPALALARVLDQQAWRLIWARSYGYSYRQIGFRLGRHDETVRRWYKDACLKLWVEACRVQARGG